MQKKILYIKAQWLWDMISWIPFLVEMKKQWHEVTQVFYDMNTLMYLYDLRKLFTVQYRKDLQKFKKTPSAQWRLRVLELFKKEWLLVDIFFIPFGIFSIFWKIITHIRWYDEAIITIWTKPARKLWMLLAKKSRVIFTDSNDNSTWKTLSEWELWFPIGSLYHYHNDVHFPLEPWTKKPLPENYIVLFPSLFARSPEIEVWKAVIDFCSTQWYACVVVGSNREQWFIDSLTEIWYETTIINLLDQTTFGEMHRIIKHSRMNILCNGWVMWLANLVNPNNITIHTVSAFLMEPPVDNKTSFTIRPYEYKHCRPCEWTERDWTIEQCVFLGTIDEGVCRKANWDIQIIYIIKKVLLNKL